ncbi:MAG TPA: glycoside hydrolase family 30 beta sandwich domain-containing protein, partial [Polyangiaceae bacterium]|nr:glycoside hydrolase family 30 beta sandwich domain-containing protein [Polyangiaceae bacterium]
PEPGSDLELTVDVSDRHRALIGIGASLAYSEDLIAAHPDKQALFDAMFVDSGFEAIRLRNRYETGTEDLSAVAEIVAAATERLGYEPSLLMTSGSPPAALKENGERFCGSTDPACTLGRDAQGDFDYAGFAEHWRASLDAYATAGVVPTFVSIQNHPSWVPTDSTEQEACWFLPTEGTTELVGTDGVPVPAELPGYDAALAAVRASAASVGDYQFVAAETAEWTLTAEYAPALTLGDLGALAFTLYGFDALSLDEGALEGLRNLAALGESSGLPILQTEMRSTGIETAALAHYALAEADSGAYFHLDFVGLAAGDETPVTLIAVDDGAIEPLPNYHALAHFARHTEPGWLRVGTTSDAPSGLLVSAWLAPDQSALTLVLVNPTGESIDVTLNQPELELPIADGQLLRTVFDGSERSAELGSVGSTGRVRVPGRSVVTVALGAN